MSDPGKVLRDEVAAAVAKYDAAVAPLPMTSVSYGVNDPVPWSSLNPANSPKIQQLLIDMRPGLYRLWFHRTNRDGTTMTSAHRSQKMAVARGTGAKILVVLRHWQDSAWCSDVVTQFKGQVWGYEFGNEPYGAPSTEGIPSLPSWQQRAQTYATFAANMIPQLKAMDPAAKFFGPAAAGSYNDLYGWLSYLQSAGDIFDAITFHRYTPDLAEMTRSIQSARSSVDKFFGSKMPIGMTEWNLGDPPSMVNDNQAYYQKTLDMQNLIAESGLLFACQFDIANQSAWPSLDMIDVTNISTDAQLTVDRIKGAYYGMKAAIAESLA